MKNRLVFQPLLKKGRYSDVALFIVMQLGQAIRYYLDPLLAEKGYVLVNAQHQKDTYHGVKITLTIDRLDGKGVTHDDCVAVTHIAKAQFEELLEDYILEVSSPGIKKKKPELSGA